MFVYSKLIAVFMCVCNALLGATMSFCTTFCMLAVYSAHKHINLYVNSKLINIISMSVMCPYSYPPNQEYMRGLAVLLYLCVNPVSHGGHSGVHTWIVRLSTAYTPGGNSYQLKSVL